MKLYSSPRWIVLQLLRQCNLRCNMCYEWGKNGAYGDEDTQQLDIDVLKRIIKECREYTPYYDLFGGEPLLYEHLEELLELIHYYGSEVDMPTNGVLLRDKVEILLKNPPNRIWVSLDGPEEINDEQRGRGVYKRAIEGIDLLIQERNRLCIKKPLIGVSCIVTTRNYLYLEQFIEELVHDRKLDQFSIEMQLFLTKEQCDEYLKILKDNFGIFNTSYAQGMIWNKDDFLQIDVKELIRQIEVVKQICKRNNIFLINYPRTVDFDNYSNYFKGNYASMLDNKSRCVLPWTHLEIAANGEVAPCHTYYDLTFGNVNNSSLLEIWNNAKFVKYRDYMKNNMLPICTACARYYAYNTKKQIIGG